MSDPQAAPADPTNAHLAPGPCSLTVASATLRDATGAPTEERLLATVRTSSATVPVFLTAAEAREWVTLLGDAERKMTGLVLAAAMPAGLVVPGRA